MTTPTPEPTHPSQQCGASTGAIRLGDAPLHHIGPCVLRKDHDGPVHQAADGVQWAGEVGSPVTTPEPALRDQLVRRRQVLGISQAELAARLGVTQTAVSYWESGQRQPGLDDVERWATALGAPPTLLQGSPTAESSAPDAALRDQIADALQRHTEATALPTPFPPDLPEGPWLEAARRANEDRADAVMPVVAAVLAAARDEAARERQRAEQAERERDEALLAADPMKVGRVKSLVAASTRLVRIERDAARQQADQAEAAVQRARDVARHPRTSMGRAQGYVMATDVLAALDRPEET